MLQSSLVYVNLLATTVRMIEEPDEVKGGWRWVVLANLELGLAVAVVRSNELFARDLPLKGGFSS